MVLLDEVCLEQKRLGDAVGQHILQALRALDHADVADVEAWPEIGADPVTQKVRFSDIEDPPLGVFE